MAWLAARAPALKARCFSKAYSVSIAWASAGWVQSWKLRIVNTRLACQAKATVVKGSKPASPVQDPGPGWPGAVGRRAGGPFFLRPQSPGAGIRRLGFAPLGA